MNDKVLRLVVAAQITRAAVMQRLREDERGEGVISAAIAVLIMAFLGVLVWQGLRGTLQTTQNNVNDQVDLVGR